MLCRNDSEYVNKLFHSHFHQLFSGWMVIRIDDEMPPFALTFWFQRCRFQQGWWNYLKGAKRQFFYVSVHAVVKTVQAEQWADTGPTSMLLSEHTICQAIDFWRCQRHSAEWLANRSDASRGAVVLAASWCVLWDTPACISQMLTWTQILGVGSRVQ